MSKGQTSSVKPKKKRRKITRLVNNNFMDSAMWVGKESFLHLFLKNEKVIFQAILLRERVCFRV